VNSHAESNDKCSVSIGIQVIVNVPNVLLPY